MTVTFSILLRFKYLFQNNMNLFLNKLKIYILTRLDPNKLKQRNRKTKLLLLIKLY